ncbi:helix-turn-helix domain-containing protein [Halorubrum sp. DTA98]|uniref:helix-turn-helix domain-containing protein n=1 Tax=Halorubrum sp. DTA98 TaxID=3402163 RepID=UPI003AAD7C97
MTWVRFRLGLPDGSWIADVSRANPMTTYRALGIVSDDDVGYTLLSVVGPKRESAAEDLDVLEGIEQVETLGSDEFETTLHVTGETPQFFDAVRRSGLPVEPPIEVVDGGTSIEVAGDHERISSLGRHLASLDIAFDVELVGQYDAANRVLTDTQRDLVLAAIDAGYYATPRRCTLTELAEREGIAKSTCSETLQRAEERLMKRFAEGLPHDETADTTAKREVVVS